MRLKCYAFWVLILFVSTTVHAQLLWEISGNNLQKPSYLFGSHHLVEKELLYCKDSLKAVFDRSDAVVGEVITDQPDLSTKIVRAGSMDPATWKVLISSKDYALLDSEFVNVLGVGMDRLSHYKPMMLLSVYQIRLYMKMLGLQRQPVSPDMSIQKDARKVGKKVLALEDLSDQTDVLFNKIPLQRQSEILLGTVRRKGLTITSLNLLSKEYLSENLFKLDSIASLDTSMLPDEREALLETRNQKWMQKLPAMFSNQSCLVVVGALHLTGKKGLINALRRKGFSVEPVVIR